MSTLRIIIRVAIAGLWVVAVVSNACSRGRR